MYTSERPTSWALQELAAHSLTTNTAIISKRRKVDSGEWSIWDDKVSRNIPTQVDKALQRVPELEHPNFWLTKIRGKSAMGLLGVLSLKDRKRLAKAPLLKGEMSYSA